MRKLSLSMLAASTLLIAGTAAAQPGPGARPPGATWHGGGMMGGNVQMRGPNMQMRGNMGNVRVRTGGGFQMHGGNFRMHRWGPRPGADFRHSRLRRGGFINSFWFAPQFFIGDWGSYGFSAPGDDQRWVRYYDDAYLVDGDGRVMDTRYGVRWDRYGGDWDVQDGIPGYRGDWRDYDDSEYAEESDGREGYAEMREDMRGGDMREHHMEMRRHGEMMRGPGGPMMPPPGYGPPPGTRVYGGGYGYGMYAYPIVIETVTTTGGGGYIEEVTEEVVQTAHRRRAVRPRPRCSCAPAPRPVVRRPAPRPVHRRPPAGARG
jgi:Ni/Co efflux regulator RcnB